MKEKGYGNLPETPEEWQAAVDETHVLLDIERLRQEGLIEGGPDINVELCQEILNLGLALGYVPNEESFHDVIEAIMLLGEKMDEEELKWLRSN